MGKENVSQKIIIHAKTFQKSIKDRQFRNQGQKSKYKNLHMVANQLLERIKVEQTATIS